MGTTDDELMKGSCTFCGGSNATGYWHGLLAEVFCCHGCAVTVVPRLIADAVSKFQFPTDATMTQIKAEFWRAALIAAMRRQREGVASGRIKPGAPPVPFAS